MVTVPQDRKSDIVAQLSLIRHSRTNSLSSSDNSATYFLNRNGEKFITMSISTKIPHSLFFRRLTAPLLKSSKAPSFSSVQFPRLFFFKPVVFRRLSTNQPFFSSCPSAMQPSASIRPVEELPPKFQEIVELFQGVQEPRAKYEQLLFYGRNLKPLEPQYRTSDNKVHGCVSQVWVRAYLDGDKNVIFEADSDSVLTKGLAALLVKGLSGWPAEEIVKVSPDFLLLLGLQQSLTPSRNNGFLNMLKLMQKKALQLYVESEKGDGSSSDTADKGPLQNPTLVSNDDIENGGTESSHKDSDWRDDSSSGSVLSGRGLRIKQTLENELSPVLLEIEDVSYQHAGHAGVRGSDGETHFNVRVVSHEFEGKSLVKRHRLIYGLLQNELQGGLHALSITPTTPAEVGNQ